MRDDVLAAAVEGQAGKSVGFGSVTARRHTSSIETRSNFQRFSARIVRSRNCGVISRHWLRLKRRGSRGTHALEPQDDSGAAGLPLPQPEVAAEISELHPGPLQDPISDANVPPPSHRSRCRRRGRIAITLC